MSQKNVPSDTCQACKKAWLTNHTLAAVGADGKISIHCHEQPVDKTDFVLKFVLDTRAAKLEAQSEIVNLKKQGVLDRQAIGAEMKRDYDSAVEAAADRKFETTRAALISTHDALVLDLKARLKDAEGIAELLAEEKTAIAGKLAASEEKSVGQQLEIVELTTAGAALTARHKGLKERSLDLVRNLISMGTRVAVLEEKTGVIPKVDPKRIYAMLTEQEYDDEDTVPVDDLRNDPTPVPPPAPKADVATAPVAANQNAPTAPVQPTNVVVLDDPEPESESSASADDEDDGHDHDVDEEQEAASDEDEEECSICNKAATEMMSFVKKDGTDGKLAACDPSMHADVFLDHLKKVAKSAPKTAVDVISLFNPIQ